jgi:pyruvate dehydrogenase E1 component alpha subunit
MIRARAFDNALMNWQRQGHIAAYAPARGQEAAQVGSALALDPATDLAFPTFRESAAAIAMEVDFQGYLLAQTGHWHGGGYAAADRHFAPFQAVVGGSVPHAVGWALGKAKDGIPAVALAYLGDGATSQGDVHEAMNFAAVLDAPVVFFVQNNGWSLSTPLERQVGGGDIAARAAADRARRDRRPALIEARTYRRGPHSTSDDPSRYRSLHELERAGEDPWDRIRARVLETGAADQAWLDAIDAAAADQVKAAYAQMVGRGPMKGADMFDLVFAQTTAQLEEQKRRWREESDHV